MIDNPRTMKATDPAIVARAVALRRTHSLKQIADELGVSVGTVKSWMNRSGVKLGDNEALRALMSLPPIKASEGTAVVVAPDLPPQEAVTGIQDVDAMLWLRAVIATEHPDHIARALEAVKRIKTPPDKIESAYAMWVRARHGDMAGVFASIGFADLKRHAEEVTRDAAIKAEGLARFGTAAALLGETDADRAIAEALSSLDWSHGEADPAEVAALFKARPDLLPMTLADCLHELLFWDSLFQLRRPFGCIDHFAETSARIEFVFAELAHIRPRDKAEAIAVLRWLAADDDGETMRRDEVQGILENLIG